MRIFVNESTGQEKIAAEIGTNRSRGNLIDRNLGDMANMYTPTAPTKEMARKEFSQAIAEAMAILSKSEQKVVKMRFGMGDDGNPPMSHAEIADACNADVELVKRIENNALAKIRDHANGSALGEYGNRVAAYVGRLLSAQTVHDDQQSSVADEPRKWLVNVIFDDGDSLETWINGTKEEIRRYYLSNNFVLSDEKTTHRGIGVEFVEDLGEVPWTYYGESARPESARQAKSSLELQKLSNKDALVLLNGNNEPVIASFDAVKNEILNGTHMVCTNEDKGLQISDEEDGSYGVTDDKSLRSQEFEADQLDAAIRHFLSLAKRRGVAIETNPVAASPLQAKSLWELKKIALDAPPLEVIPFGNGNQQNGNQMRLPNGAKNIGGGYWSIPALTASKLCGGSLPSDGNEKLVNFEGNKWAIHKAIHFGEMVWGLRWIKKLEPMSNQYSGKRVAQSLQFVEAPELDDRGTTRAIRDAIVNEQLAIQQYEAIVDGTSDDKVKEVLQDIANEERVHVSELLTLLEILLPGERKFMEEGVKEVKK